VTEVRSIVCSAACGDEERLEICGRLTLVYWQCMDTILSQALFTVLSHDCRRLSLVPGMECQLDDV
jgi:hypothetical protein